MTSAQMKKGRAGEGAPFLRSMLCSGLALTGFEPALRLVDYIDAALTAHNPAIAVTLLERAEGVANFHGFDPSLSRRGGALGYSYDARQHRRIHGGRYWDRTSDPFDVNEVLYR